MEILASMRLGVTRSQSQSASSCNEQLAGKLAGGRSSARAP